MTLLHNSPKRLDTTTHKVLLDIVNGVNGSLLTCPAWDVLNTVSRVVTPPAHWRAISVYDQCVYKYGHIALRVCYIERLKDYILWGCPPPLKHSR